MFLETEISLAEIKRKIIVYFKFNKGQYTFKFHENHLEYILAY